MANFQRRSSSASIRYYVYPEFLRSRTDAIIDITLGLDCIYPR